MHERRRVRLPHPGESGRAREPARTGATSLPAVVAAAAIAFAVVVAATPGRAQDATQTPALVVQTGHQEQINRVAFSADSRMLASGDIRGSIRVWETATGKQIFALPGHVTGVDGLRFSQDGRVLASVTSGRGEDGEAKVWDVRSGRERGSWSFPEHSVTGLDISADGTLIAVASDLVRIWNIASGEQLAAIPTDDRRPTLAFEPHGSLLAIRDPSRVRFWSPSGLEEDSIELRNLYGERDMVFLADGRTLAVPDGDRIVVVDVPERKTSGRFGVDDPEARIFRFADSAAEIVVRVRGRHEVWDVERRKKVRDFEGLERWSGEVPSPSWRWLTTVPGGDVNDLEGGRAPFKLGGRIPAAGAVAFSRDGTQLATRTGRRFWVWDLAGGDPPRLFDGHSEISETGFGIDSLSFGAGDRLISTDPLFGLIEWDAAAGKVTNSARVPRPEGRALVNACSADGRWCVSGHNERIEVRDTETWRVDRTFDASVGRGVAISGDGTWLATPFGNGAGVFDRRNGRVRLFEAHEDTVSRVTLSIDGRLLASADFAGTVKIWEVESGRELRAFPSGHNSGITSLAFSPDGRVLATGGSDQTVRLWDPSSGALHHALEGHADWVAALAFNPTGRLLASGSADGTIRLWNTQSGAAVALLTAASGTPDWLVVTPDGYFDGSAGADDLVAWRIGTAAYSPESYFNDFFEPGVLARVARGAPAAQARIDGLVVPPLVRILESGGRTLQEPNVTLKMRTEGDVAEVSLYHNGARVATRSSADAAGEYAFDLELIPGENELRGIAVSPAGVASNPDSIRLTYDAPAPARPVLHVLAIGVSRYQEPSWNLGQARADAEAIAAFFRDRSAKLFETVHATVLADEQASRANIQAAIEAIGAAAQPQDVTLIYFAGHGVAVDQTYYLLPHDMRNESSLETDVKKFGLSDRALLDSLRTVRALKKIVLLDACQSGGALDILGRAPAAERAALESLVRAEGLFIIAASTRQQEAMEVRELGHGVFTYALLSGLGATGDATVPPVVTMHQLLAYVGQKVPELAARYGRTTRQVPVSVQRGMDFPVAVR